MLVCTFSRQNGKNAQRLGASWRGIDPMQARRESDRAMSSQPIRTDVAIAGGGMVGLTLALALAQGGMRVAIADPMTPAQLLDERFDGRVSALAFATVRMMRILGLWDVLAPDA